VTEAGRKPGLTLPHMICRRSRPVAPVIPRATEAGRNPDRPLAACPVKKVDQSPRTDPGDLARPVTWPVIGPVFCKYRRPVAPHIPGRPRLARNLSRGTSLLFRVAATSPKSQRNANGVAAWLRFLPSQFLGRQNPRNTAFFFVPFFWGRQKLASVHPGGC